MQGRQTRWLHDPRAERDACGVGFVVNVKGEPSRDIIERGKVMYEAHHA